ncbi:MAG: FKBP-type peptidyl-prolyl cis-trans isomerase [Bacteroidota bacterium]
MRRIFIALLVGSTLLSSCYKKDINTTTCEYDPCSLKAPQSEITQLESYLSGAGITTAVKHCSGMYYEIISPGADKTPTVCSYVSVNYIGMLTNGTVFDQTTTDPYVNAPIALIEGWKKGIPLIKKGGKIRLYIPPSLGYGSTDQKDPNTGAVIIPANSILIFDIELLDVQ